jgi:hypothetical protein
MKKDDSMKFYDRFIASDVKNKSKLNNEILYQLYKRVVKEKKAYAPKIMNPPDHSKNKIHQMDLLFMPDDDGYKYALTVVDTGSRLTDVEPLKTKTAKDVLNAIKNIYKRGILKMPIMSVEVDNGSEFKGVFKEYFKDIFFRVAQTGRSRQQGLVENRNGLIAKTLLRRMTGEELITHERSVEWVHYLPKLIKMMNKDYYMKPIKLTVKMIMADPLVKEGDTLLEEGQLVRYQLDKPIDVITSKKLTGSFREGDIRYSIKPVKIERIQIVPGQPVFYKLESLTPLYTKPQLIVVDKNSKLPPSSIQNKFIVDNIVGKRKVKNKVQYLVKWKGYASSKNTWEPRDKLIKDVPLLIKEFEKK